jgi:chloramphenicol-sensitive protein RarD
MAEKQESRLDGVLYGAGAYFFWGFSVLYWKLLAGVGPLETVSHRVLWAFFMLGGILWWRGRLPNAWQLLRVRKTFLILCLTSFLIAINWSIFVWTVMTDRVLQSSLGYYINPLVSIVIGYFLLHEKMNRLQITAIGLATLGVIGMVAITGYLPWPALALAFSFGIYGYIRKIAKFEALEALFLEMGICLPIVFGLILWAESTGQGTIGTGNLNGMILLIGAGLVTLVPLWLFGEGVIRARLSTMGMLQYLAPTIHFGLAVFVYQEPFTAGHIVAFGCIWLALVLYSFDALWQERSNRAAS